MDTVIMSLERQELYSFCDLLPEPIIARPVMGAFKQTTVKLHRIFRLWGSTTIPKLSALVSLSRKSRAFGCLQPVLLEPVVKVRFRRVVTMGDEFLG